MRVVEDTHIRRRSSSLGLPVSVARMQQALRHEAEYFDEKKRLLRAIFNETIAQCIEAYRSKNVPKDKFREMCLKGEDEKYIRAMIENPISIVLLGNRPCVKARIANYILGYELLPVFDLFDPDYKQARRSVRVVYGTQRRSAFCIRNFELIECQPLYTERVVSFEDLRLDPVAPSLGISMNCNSSTSLAEPMSSTSSGHGSDRSSNSSAAMSLNSSASLKLPRQSSAIPSSSSSLAYSSHGRKVGSNFELRRHEFDDEDEDEDYGEVDAVNEMTTLEIVLTHELLEKNLQIRIAPDVENFDIIYKSTFHKTNPIIMYCFERYDDKLTDADIAHLDQLRQLMPSTPILFAHIVDFDPTYHTCKAPVNHVHIQPSQHPYFSTSSIPNGLKPKQQYYNSMEQCSCTQQHSDLTESDQQEWSQARQQCRLPPQNWSSGSMQPQAGSCSNCCSSPPVAPKFGCSKKMHKSPSHSPSPPPQSPTQDCSCNEEMPNYLQASEALWKQLCELGFFHEHGSSLALQGPLDRQQKRLSNGYYIINDLPFKCAKQNADYGIDVRSRFLCHSYEFCYFVDFFRAILKSNLVVAATLLNEIHNQFIQYFIFSAFDMTWNLNFSIPRRLEYAKAKEAELYMSLMGIANRKQDEIRQLIGEMVEFMREDILEQASNYVFANPNLNKISVMVSASNLKDCIDEIQEFVFVMLNRAIAVKLISSVDVMRETFIGTLQRCLSTLESSRPDKDSEKVRQEDKIDFALSRLLDSAYSIEINVNTCNSIMRIFWDRLKQFVVSCTFAWRPNCLLDAEWKRKVAADLIDNLSEAKLAKCICTQFREKLKVAHDNFVGQLSNLESVLTNKMKETDTRRQQVRKNDAPLFARLALESTSFIDAILYGVPELSKEIGRGQYGVVFSTKKSWAGYSRIAVKSIMICDDKHWNDLAMEFYYARSLPENDRMVQIRGSIIEHNYNGSSSYVYLIMERLTRDLYAGLKAGIDWLVRLQVALDVVHGLRFLHNHGLIHRDIKLKNVLLDKHNRAKITDLGFCKSEVMISGSIVGTPIHMAPEVFTGKYDSMVDVYAFGILFWYICAGSVELPQIFEQCHNKDHLWIAVKKGLRPERLAIFDDQCYNLMERCWAGDPTRRPILGEVEDIINDIKDRYTRTAK